MAKLSKTNKYAISWLNQQGMTNEEISKELTLPLTQVARCIKTETSKESGTASENEPVSKQSSKDLMITKTSGKGNSHVAIMTKAASEVNDEEKKKMEQTTNSSLDTPGIFRPIK